MKTDKGLLFIVTTIAALTSIVGCATMDNFYGESVATIDGVEVRAKTDDFTGHTSYTVTVQDDTAFSGPPSGNMTYTYNSRGVYLGEYWRAAQPEWLFPQVVMWNIDGNTSESEIIDVHEEIHSGGYISERVFFAMTREQLEAIANSDRTAISVRGRQYKEEWVLRPEHRDATRALLTHVDSL